MDWLLTGIIAGVGFLGNFVMLKILTLKRDKMRNGWTDRARFEFGITVGVVARSALEIAVVVGVNFASFSQEPVSIEDIVAIVLLLFIAAFCFSIRPSLGHLNHSQSSVSMSP